MAANHNGDNITAGNTNHCDDGTELISRGDGFPSANDYVLHVAASPLAGLMFGLRVEGKGGVVTDPQGQTFIEGGGANIQGASGPGVVTQGGNAGVIASGGGVGVIANGGVAGVSGRGQTGVVGQGPIGVLGGGDAEGVRGAGNIGVRGFGATVGVQGQSTSGSGVVGISASDRSGGVVGVIDGGSFGFGVLGSATAVPGSLEFFGSAIQGEAALTADRKRYQGWAGSFIGPVFCGGNLTVFDGDFTVIGGAKSAAVRHVDGTYRRLYTVESPESWFEDFGEATLTRGKCHVALDADFASLIHNDHYHVFVTPLGDCNGLHIANRSKAGFDVIDSKGGTSDISFSYRLVAKRKDIRGARLDTVDLGRHPERSTLTPKSMMSSDVLTETQAIFRKVDDATTPSEKTNAT